MTPVGNVVHVDNDFVLKERDQIGSVYFRRDDEIAIDRPNRPGKHVRKKAIFGKIYVE